jgi:CRP-like cAMP-binding protein
MRAYFEHALRRGEEKIASLMSGTAVRLNVGATLVPAGPAPSYVYRLLEGWAYSARELGDGREQVTLTFLPGELFPIACVFFGAQRNVIRTATAGVVERIDVEQLRRAQAEDPDIAARCMQQLLEESQRLDQSLIGLGRGNAEARLAMFLLDLRDRLSGGPTCGANAMVFPFPLTQRQVADHLGLTAIHVNRVLRVLRQEGVVTVRAGCVEIADIAALERRASAVTDARQYLQRIAPARDEHVSRQPS